MGYTTDFTGKVLVTWCRTWSGKPPRMRRGNGPYFVDGSGYAGQGRDADIEDYNQQPADQPGLWCGWVPTEDGAGIEWNGVEKFYRSAEWMTYLIDTFLKPGATVQKELAAPASGWIPADELRNFTFDHHVNGVIEAQGEDDDDRWDLVVQDNVVIVETPASEA